MNNTILILLLSILVSINSIVFHQLHTTRPNSNSLPTDVEVTHTSTKQIVKISDSKYLQLLTVPDAYKFYQYSSGQCCLQAVFNYYQFPISPSPYRQDYFINSADQDADNFTTPEKLIAAAQRRLNNETNETRRNAFGLILQQSMEYSVLQRALILQIPVILLISKQEGQNGQYVIAVGFDETNYYFEDPSTLGSIAYIAKNQLSRHWQVYIKSQNRWVNQLGIIIQLKGGRTRETVPTIRPLP